MRLFDVEYKVVVYPRRAHVAFGRKWLWSAEATEQVARLAMTYATHGHKTQEAAVEALKRKVIEAHEENAHIEANTSTTRFTITRA